nr:MAG TPA: Fumarylacetoacetase N-terminal domain 2 [Caudoviricetes sp.]
MVGTPISIKITLRSQLPTMLALLDNWSKVDTKPQML